MKKFLKKLKSWKPIHLCWLFKKLGLPIPPYLIGAGTDFSLSGSRIANATRVWQANEDIDIADWDKTNDFIIAAAVGCGAHASGDETLQIRWRDVNDGGSFVALSNTGELTWSATTDLVNDNALETGEKGCTSALTTFVNGLEKEGANDAATVVGNDEWTEHHWAIDCNGADDGHEYEFEIYSTTEGDSVGTCLATITMATGAVTHYGSATLSGVGTLAGIGALIVKGLATLSGTGLLSAIGQVATIHLGSVTLTGTGLLGAIGSYIHTATVALSGIGTLSTIGNTILVGVATLSGVGSIVGKGIITAIGKATLGGVGTVSIIGTVISGGAAVSTKNINLSNDLLQL